MTSPHLVHRNRASYPHRLWTTTYPSVGAAGDHDGDRETTNRSAPEQWRWSAARGPGRTKGNDRLMDSLHQPADTRPALCPTCGRPAIAEGVSVLRGVATNHCTDERGHIWIVRWMVAA